MASERLRACVEKMDDEALAAVVCAVRRADGDDAAVQTRGSHVFVLFKGTDDSKGVAWICTEETPTTDRLEKFPALVDDLGADRGIVTNATGEPIDDVPDGVEYLDFDGIVDAIEAAGVTETVLATHGDISEDSAEAATAAKEVTDTGSDTPAPDDREQAQPETQQPPADERLPGSQSHEPPPQEERAETSQRQDGPQTDQHVRDDHPSPAQSQRGGQPRSQQPPQQGSHQPQGGQPQQAGHRQQEQPQQGIPGDGDRSPQAQQPQRGGEPATQPPGGILPRADLLLASHLLASQERTSHSRAGQPAVARQTLVRTDSRANPGRPRNEPDPARRSIDSAGRHSRSSYWWWSSVGRQPPVPGNSD
ncbi:hypothetical protein Hrd1104_04675 [Halorhabdus sp. CBA1104]|uniref:hypothetical protein n=1 Tax=Halorhabdus sp. CBA1104 TaxID=1380432 RepID=UPI0012B3C268|nr:hypothetical protein [Halorhabdus sp. CBA1104]QGN06656.1 hypothetical protein Hrd1104_04675 [Halorhabdus sp. CBA1104]